MRSAEWPAAADVAAGPAPWVRTRLRTAPGAAWALALLVALTACLAAAFPRAVDRYEDAGLRRAAEQARPDRTGMRGVRPAARPDAAAAQREDDLRPDALAAQYAKVRAQVPRPLVLDEDQSTYGVRTAVDLVTSDPWLPQPTGETRRGVPDRPGRPRRPRRRRPGTPAARRRPGDRRDGRGGGRGHHGDRQEPAHQGRFGDPRTRRGTTPSPSASRASSPPATPGAYWSAQPLLRTPTLVRLPAPVRRTCTGSAPCCSPPRRPRRPAGPGPGNP